MERETSITERRRHPRRKNAPGHVQAILRTQNSIGEYVLYDLSVGGALVVGCALPVNTVVEIVLRTGGDLPVRVLGRVVRGGGTASAVAFLHRGDDAEDAIQSLVLRQLEEARVQH